MTEDEMVGWLHQLNVCEFEQTPGDLPDPGIEPWSSELQTDSVPSEIPGKPQKLIELVNKLSKVKEIQPVHPKGD